MSPIWVPPRAVEYRCLCCGAEFSDKRKGQRHAARCVLHHRDEIAAHQATKENAITRVADEEMWRWGRRREGKGLVGFKRGRAA